MAPEGLLQLPGGIFVIQKPCPVGQQHQPPLQRGTPLQKNIQFVPTLCCKRGQTEGVSPLNSPSRLRRQPPLGWGLWHSGTVPS